MAGVEKHGNPFQVSIFKEFFILQKITFPAYFCQEKNKYTFICNHQD